MLLATLCTALLFFVSVFGLAWPLDLPALVLALLAITQARFPTRISLLDECA